MYMKMLFHSETEFSQRHDITKIQKMQNLSLSGAAHKSGDKNRKHTYFNLFFSLVFNVIKG